MSLTLTTHLIQIDRFGGILACTISKYFWEATNGLNQTKMDKSWVKTSSHRHVTRSPASPGRRRRGRRRRGWGRAWSAWWRWWRGGGRHATGPAPAPHRVIEYQHSAPRRHSVARNNIVITIIQGQFLAATDGWRRSPGRDEEETVSSDNRQHFFRWHQNYTQL